MLDLLPDPARLAVIASSVAYAGFWSLVLAFALVSVASGVACAPGAPSGPRRAP